MKKFLAILILILTFQTPSQADDIRDLEIEGMSIGDSLLEYFSEKKIIASIKDIYSMKKDKTFVMAGFSKYENNFETYDAVQITIKKNDKDYIIHNVTGKNFSNYDKEIEACYEHQDRVIKELTPMFKNQEIHPVRIVKHWADKSGRSTQRQAAFIFKHSRDLVIIECYDWHKDMGYKSNFRIVLITKEFNDWVGADN